MPNTEKNRNNTEDCKKFYLFFSELSKENQAMATGYLSALRDKEVADNGKQLQEV